MDVKEHVKVFLSFSKKERRGVYILLIIAVLLWALPLFFSDGGMPEEVLQITPIQISKAKKILISGQDSIRHNRKYRSYYPPAYPKYSRGTTPSVPYPSGESRITQQRSEIKVVDLNEVDSAALERLPGIGERLSSRIIKYRDRLGGFHAILQLKEVYGLRDSTFALLAERVTVTDKNSIKKISINQCSYADLRRHPYMTHAFAKSLVAYRDLHGPFQATSDLYKLVTVTKELVDKMAPYFSFDE